MKVIRKLAEEVEELRIVQQHMMDLIEDLKINKDETKKY